MKSTHKLLFAIACLALAALSCQTRFLAEQPVITHWYDMAPARRDFGYLPRVSFAEGLERLRQAHARGLA